MEPTSPSRAAPVSWRSLAVLLVATAVIQLLTLPRFEYPGDNLVARAEAINLVQDGRLGFPLAEKRTPELEPFVRERGQYFYENDAKGVMYSKYGFGYTLLYVVPVAIARALGASLRPIEGGGSLFLIVNLYDVAFALGVVFYLYRLMALYTVREWARVGLVLAAVYPSYVWHYLRAPALEIYQLFFFVAFCAHLLGHLRRAAAGDGGGRAATRELLLASFAAGFLLLFRPTFGVLVPLVVVAAATAGPEARLRERLGANLGPRLRRLLLAGCGPALLLTMTWLIVNAVRTGSPLDAGYAQWLDPDGRAANRFTASAIPAALRAFLLQPGNYNVFLHQPLVAAGLLGLPAFFRRRRREAAVLLAVVVACVAPILAASNWDAGWSYGPRYLVHPLLLLCVPAAFAAERVLALRPAARGGVLAAAGVLLAAFLALQIQMNSVHYFVFQYSLGWFSRRLPDPRVERWFAEPRLLPVYARGLKRFVAAAAPFEPVDLALERLPPAERPRAREAIRRELEGLVEPNWYLARR